LSGVIDKIASSIIKARIDLEEALADFEKRPAFRGSQTHSAELQCPEGLRACSGFPTFAGARLEFSP